jgi:hypothetical protein
MGSCTRFDNSAFIAAVQALTSTQPTTTTKTTPSKSPNPPTSIVSKP